MRVVTHSQGTAEWLQARVGKIGASNIHKAMAFLTRASGSKQKGDSSAVRDQFILELATELITRVPFEHYVSPAMDIGTQYESEARIEYWIDTGNEVEQTGFVLHPTIDFLGASPDGLVPSKNRGLEIKVPMLHTHMKYLREGVVPEEYVPQMQLGMLCCGLPEWDFMSYCPPDVYAELPDRFRRFIVTLPADPELHRKMEDAAVRAMEDATALVGELSKRFPENGECKSRMRVQLENSLPDYDPSKPFADQNFDFLDANRLNEAP